VVVAIPDEPDDVEVVGRRPMATITQSVLVDVVHVSVIAPDVVAIL